MDNKVKQIFEREIERHSKEIEKHKDLYIKTNSKKQRIKMDKHFHKKFQTILLAKELGLTFCECCGSLISHQIKKDRHVACRSDYLDTRSKPEGEYKDERKTGDADNQSGEKHFFVECDVIAKESSTAYKNGKRAIKNLRRYC